MSTDAGGAEAGKLLRARVLLPKMVPSAPMLEADEQTPPKNTRRASALNSSHVILRKSINTLRDIGQLCTRYKRL